MFVARRLSTLDAVISTATHFVLRRYKDKGVLFAGEERTERRPAGRMTEQQHLPYDSLLNHTLQRCLRLPASTAFLI